MLYECPDYQTSRANKGKGLYAGSEDILSNILASFLSRNRVYYSMLRCWGMYLMYFIFSGLPDTCFGHHYLVIAFKNIDVQMEGSNTSLEEGV